MKKFLIPVIALTLAGSLTLSSCLGSFSLSKSLLNWNNQVGDKFVNELVFVAFWILPVYEVSLAADLLVLNSIEFWSGNKPLAQGKKIIEGNDGRYIVDCDGHGYTITSENDGSQVRLDFNVEEQAWSYSVGENDPVVFLTFIDDDHVRLPGVDGSDRIVELSAAGLQAYTAEAQTVRCQMAMSR